MFPPSGPLLKTIDLPSGEKADDATWVPLSKRVSCLVPVPSGFCVTAAGYFHFLKETGLDEFIRTTLKGLDTKNLSDLQKRGFFGHLMSPNRLCVSMSRQKRVLVVAGDSQLLEHELARESVPALVDFHDLCRTQGVVL